VDKGRELVCDLGNPLFLLLFISSDYLGFPRSCLSFTIAGPFQLSLPLDGFKLLLSPSRGDEELKETSNWSRNPDSCLNLRPELRGDEER